MIKYADSTEPCPPNYFDNQERIYEVTFAEKTLYVRASDLSQAEHENGAISCVRYLDIKLFVPSQVYYVSSGADLKLAENPNTEIWRRGPNWT